MFGDRYKVLKPQQVKTIAAQTNFLCIEKSHGLRPLGAAEKGAKHETIAFKKENPKSKVLFYFNAAYAWPYTSYNQPYTREEVEKNPERQSFFVKHHKTGALADRYGALCYDVLNPDLRTWWVATVVKGMRETGADGVFIDQMHGNVDYRKNKRKEVEIAMGKMMADLKKAMGEDKILLANNAYKADSKHVFPVSDAIMFENYARVKYSKESLLEQWGHMERIAKAGKISVFRFGVDGTWRGNLKPNMPALSKEKAEFALACYLIGAQPYSYFLYSWGWKVATGAMVDYPDFKNKLGAPKGRYTRVTPDGWEFTREFAHASVWVNTETREAKVTWK